MPNEEHDKGCGDKGAYCCEIDTCDIGNKTGASHLVAVVNGLAHESVAIKAIHGCAEACGRNVEGGDEDWAGGAELGRDADEGEGEGCVLQAEGEPGQEVALVGEVDEDAAELREGCGGGGCGGGDGGEDLAAVAEA